MDLLQCYKELCKIGETASQVANVLQRERTRDQHRLFMATNELALTIQHAVTALSEKTREVIAKK
jgi:hypothetical protein